MAMGLQNIFEFQNKIATPMKQEEDKLVQRDARKTLNPRYFQTLCLFLFLAILSDLNSSMCIS